MRPRSRQIARVIPRRTVPILAVALLAVGCTSEPSPAEKRSSAQAAKRQAAADAELRASVKTIKQCAQDNDGEYPPGVANQGGTITMLCGPVSRNLVVPRGGHLTYKPKAGGFTLEIELADGTKLDYNTPTAGPSASSGPSS